MTPREREVLHWVAAGKTDREIADILGMSPRTVQKHLQHIYEKLGERAPPPAAEARPRESGSGPIVSCESKICGITVFLRVVALHPDSFLEQLLLSFTFAHSSASAARACAR